MAPSTLICPFSRYRPETKSCTVACICCVGSRVLCVRNSKVNERHCMHLLQYCCHTTEDKTMVFKLLRRRDHLLDAIFASTFLHILSSLFGFHWPQVQLSGSQNGKRFNAPSRRVPLFFSFSDRKEGQKTRLRHCGVIKE